MERQRADKGEFVTKFVEILSYDYFDIKISFKFLIKSVLPSVFLLIT